VLTGNDWPVDDDNNNTIMMDGGGGRAASSSSAIHHSITPSASNVSNAPSNTTSSSARQQQHQHHRDQQIFRRAGSTSSPSYSSHSRGESGGGKSSSSANIMGGGGGGQLVFESYEASLNHIVNNCDHSNNDDSTDNANSSGEGKTSSLLAKIANVPRGENNASSSSSVGYHHAHAPHAMSAVAQIRQRYQQPPSQPSSSGLSPRMANASSTSTIVSTRTVQSVSNIGTNSVPSEPRKSPTGGGGVVNKLVGFFSKQQSPVGKNSISNSGVASSPKSIVGASSNTQGASSGVQFHVPQSQNNNISRQPTTLNINTNPQNPHNHPPISPARSNAQSSVTGYSGESSSYNPTGWPGTVDKRGRTYIMECSYSESEEGSRGGSSVASPRRNVVGGGGGGVGRQSFDHQQLPQSQYPTQQYRQHDSTQYFNKEMYSFDADSQAELEEWMKSDAGSASHDYVPASAAPRSSGPVDLDEAYEQRDHFDRNGGGWREGRQQSLAGISEGRSAADFHLEASLTGMSVQESATLQQQQQQQAVDNNSGYFRRSGTEGTAPCSSPTSSILDAEARLRGIDTSLSEQRVRDSGKKVRSPPLYDDEADFGCSPDEYNTSHSPIQPPTVEALQRNDSRSAPPRPGGSVMLKGYRGFIDKTKDVPNLMDDLESEASTSLGTHSDGRRLAGSDNNNNMGLSLPPARYGRVSPAMMGLHPRPPSLVSSNFESDSDVFDGIDDAGPMDRDLFNVAQGDVARHRKPKAIAPTLQNRTGFGQNSFSIKSGSENTPFSSEFNPFATNRVEQPRRQIQQQNEGGLFDPTLNISAVSNGSVNSGNDLVDLDDFVDDGFESLPDLSIYCIAPEVVRLMVRAFRKICTTQMEISSSEETMLYDFENLVDTKKRFALFEMRSRIMETDIDRGLERRGGTNVVDDIVLTSYFQASQRIRDAVIVSKAWRDGATPKDVVTAHLLTRRSAKAHFVRRPIHRIRRPGEPAYPEYWMEEVTWLDDTDFMMMKCQSLGAGTMKGFEMFTIGDCQSILLKMTSDNCTQLRRELRAAMLCQIEAEEFMQDEIDLDGDENIVAESEQLYRDATIEVKSLSMKLVLADRAFALVRSRMERLVETIESLLVQIENDGDSQEGTSTTNSDNDDSDTDNSFDDDDQERDRLIERAKRAEMSVEVAVRETLLAKQEAEMVKAEKQREIDELKEKLSEMETKSQILTSQYIGSTSYLDKLEAKSILGSTFDKDIEDAREAARDRVKTKFRQRRSAPQSNTSDGNESKPRLNAANKQQQLNGEEMYQHLDFYSRSLKSVM